MIHKLRHVAAAVALLAALLASREAWAVRPFITDDARVVGRHATQMETYLRGDRASLQHWVLVGFGPIAPLEVTTGGVWGAAYDPGDARAAWGGPILQAKLLLHEAPPNRWPSVAIIGGVVPPVGANDFEPPGWSGFTYLALTESLGEEELLLIHGNGGASFMDAPGIDSPKVTWGLGAQLRLWRGLHTMAEIFSGDPYAAAAGGSGQMGLRYVFSNHVQIDSTFGIGLWGNPRMDAWVTTGLRLVSDPLF